MKVGLFVMAGLVVVSVAIFMIGDARRLWDPKIPFHAAFGDVAGLKPGAPVRMGGVDIGNVTKVAHSADPKDRGIYVVLSIVKSETVRIYPDTIAKVVNKGLLGDKMIELTISEGKEGAPMTGGGTLKTEEPPDLSVYLAKAEAIIDKTEATISNIEVATRALGDPKFGAGINAIVEDIHSILDTVAHQDSFIHRLLYDPKEADSVDRTLTQVEEASGQLNGLLSDLHDATSRIRQGPGIAHAVFYDGELSSQAAGAVGELHKDLAAIREGNGLLHALIYGDDSSQHVMGNVNAVSDDLRAVMAGVRAGKGTIGGLLVDPSIYEDLKSAVGNVERNEVLRALVRYSIKADEAHPRVAPISTPGGSK